VGLYLALALNNSAGFLTRSGRNDEARLLAEEALGICKDLVPAGGTPSPELATMMTALRRQVADL
jgi:hypothetical protein